MSTPGDGTSSPGPEADLFFVSTVGQARNAAAIMAATGRPARAIVLSPADNPHVGEITARHCTAAGLFPISFVTPTRGERPIRRVIRAWCGLADAVLAAHRPRRIWVANTEMFFSHIAARAAAMGAEICFFEDGLSSYRQVGAPSFQPMTFRAQMAQSRHAIGILWRRLRGPRDQGGGRVLDFLDRLLIHAEFLALATPLRRFWALGRGRDFFARHVLFDAAWATVPDALDPAYVKAKEHKRLVARPLDAEIAAAGAALRGDAPTALYLSQTYGNGVAFYTAAAEALKAEGATRLLIKFHPREVPERRAALMDALTTAGIEALPFNGDDIIPAEALIETGHFTKVYSVTSTALILGRILRPECAFAPIGQEALRRAMALTTAPWRFQRLAEDVALFERVWRINA